MEPVSPQTVTVYSIGSVPSTTNFDSYQSKNLENSMIEKSTRSGSSPIDESVLRKGGLCGLQNLGNTVKF